MRRVVILVVSVVLVAAACGGGDDGDAVDVDLEPIAAIDPCELLDESKASELAGGEVERVDDEEAGEGELGCRYDFAEGGVGSGLAAVMRLEPGDEGDVPGGGLAQALSLGDAGAVEATDTDVRVVYVVREVVVRIEVVPASGEVDDALIEEVVEFAETTEAPIVEAVTGEAPPATEETTTTTEAATTTEGPTTTTTEAPDATIADLWRRTAVEFRGQIGEQVPYECPGPGVIGTIWGTGTYTDDSSICTAAVHSGVISLETGGDVLIEITGPQDTWPSTEANGVTSSEWPEWPGGFDVLGD
jgi:hypothetical protein